MYYVYILKSKKNGLLYIGQANNLKARLLQHNTGRSFSTRKYMPWVLVYLEGYFSKSDAIDRESKLKQFGKAYAQLKRRIKNSLDA